MTIAKKKTAAPRKRRTKAEIQLAASEETKKKVLKSLQDQLKNKDADIEVFMDILNDYMALYEIKETLEMDIKKRGVYFSAKAASGRATIKKHNQSVNDLCMVNKQMLVILEKLGLTTDKTIKESNDEDKL